MIRLKSITPSKIKSFIVGNSRMIATNLGIVKLKHHEQDQILLRMLLCEDCMSNGSCSVCGCTTPNMFYDPNKLDAAGKWGRILNHEEWKRLMGKTFKEKKSTGLDKEPKQVASKKGKAKKSDAPVLRIEDLPEKKLKKLTEVYRKYYQEEDETMIFMIEYLDTDTNLGKIDLNSSTVIEHTIVNTLSFPIKINGVITSCNCTTVDGYPVKEIQPGESFDIKLRFDGKSVGKFIKIVSIQFSDNRILPIALRVQGEVVIPSGPIETEPEKIAI